MKTGIIIMLSVLVLSSLACSFTVNLPTIETGPTSTLEIAEKLPANNQELALNVEVGAAKLEMTGGAKNLVDGTVEYNVQSWKPIIERGDSSLTIRQENSSVSGIPSGDIKNNWNLKLSDQVPLVLSIAAGAYQGKMDFSGLNLVNLSVHDGASDTSIVFTEPNKGEMNELEYTTGASTVSLEGLGYANFEKMTFTGGAGTYTLDFAGKLKRDADVRVEAGISTFKIIIPDGMNAVIRVEGGLKDVSTRGTWTVDGGTYSTNGDGPTLNMVINTNLGSLDLVQK